MQRYQVRLCLIPSLQFSLLSSDTRRCVRERLFLRCQVRRCPLVSLQLRAHADGVVGCLMLRCLVRLRPLVSLLAHCSVEPCLFLCNLRAHVVMCSDPQVSGAALPARFRLTFAHTLGVLKSVTPRFLVRLHPLVHPLSSSHGVVHASVFC